MKLLQVLIVLAILSLGLFAVNQVLSFRYKSVFLQTPCELCVNLNPHLEKCINIQLGEGFNNVGEELIFSNETLTKLKGG
jgi:hypothetical protein